VAVFPITVSANDLSCPAAGSSFGDGTTTNVPNAGAPFVVGSHLYLIGGDTNNIFGNALIYKSSDAGATWALADGAGGPLIFTNNVVGVLDNDGVRIWGVFLDGTLALSIAVFDTSSDTWGPVLGTPQPIPFIEGVYMGAAQDEAGNIVAVGPFGLISFQSPGDTEIAQFNVFDGTDWSGFQNFTAPPATADLPPGLNVSLIFRAGAFLHCFFSQLNFSSTGPVPGFHQSIASGTFELGTLEEIGGAAAAVPIIDLNNGAIPVPFVAAFDGSLVTVAASGVGAIAQDFTRLFTGSAANGADLGLTLAPQELFIGGAQLQAFGLVIVSAVVYAFLAWTDSPPFGDSSFSYLAISPAGASSNLIGTTAGDRAPFLSVSDVGGSYALAFSELISQGTFFWTAVPTPPAPPAAAVSRGGGWFWWWGSGGLQERFRLFDDLGVAS
jgi:hypothetical protein